MLKDIKSPEDIKNLDYPELYALCDEIRKEIIDTVSKNGGHLASNLGAVELTVAIHRAFSSPKDAIIFDVGHQCYTHKLLTGRYDRFSTIRTEGGLSGFMRPDESEHDPFVTGHSSNSISAAYGIFRAKRISGEEGNAVAVIGDGALTGGIAYEGLNNAGSVKSNFIVILNDNKMSISRNVGAIARAITRMRNRPRYHKFKFALTTAVYHIPLIGPKTNNLIFKVKEAVKRSIYKNNIFECLGFNYLGPVDGHDIKTMEYLFTVAQKYNRPSLIHVVTTKGKGYPFAESKPKNYHGVSPFDIETGSSSAGGNMCYSLVAGKALKELAEKNPKICAVTAAMKEGTGLSGFAASFRNRFFDVGIAEQHAVTFSAGLAKGGMVPFFAVYSSFLQRAYDQIVHDCAIANMPVKFLVDRAGIVGEDGESHQGLFDVSFLTSIPNMNIYSPCFYNELKDVIKRVSENDELCAVRYPRGCEPYNSDMDFSADYSVFGEGKEKAVVTYGRIFANVFDAAKENTDVTVIKLNKIYPLSSELIDILSEFKNIIFFEEAMRSGGIAEHTVLSLSEKGYKGNFEFHNINGEFVPASSVSSALKKYGFDIKFVKEVLEKR